MNSGLYAIRSPDLNDSSSSSSSSRVQSYDETPSQSYDEASYSRSYDEALIPYQSYNKASYSQSYDETPSSQSYENSSPKSNSEVSSLYPRSPQQLAPVSLEHASKSSLSSRVNLSVLRDAPLFIWGLPAGAKLKNSITYIEKHFSDASTKLWILET